MDIKNIAETVESMLDALLQRDTYLKKRAITDEYLKLDQEIKDKRKQVENLVKSLDFDNAQLVKDELNKLENRKEMLQSSYDEFARIPDYEDADLVRVFESVKDAGDTAREQIVAQQKRLIDQLLQLQHEKQALTDTLNECIKMIRSKSNSKNDLRFKLRIREFDRCEDSELLELIQDKIELYKNKAAHSN